jgi:hypothetical protein
MQSRAKEVLCSSYLTLLISFVYNSTGGQTLVRDFAMRWIWCGSQTCKWHLWQEFLSARANRSHLSLMLSFLCVQCPLSNRTTASKMPPFFLSLFWQFFFLLGMEKSCRILHRTVMKITLQIFSLPSVFFILLYCCILCHRDMVCPESLAGFKSS